jgi:hypothetical protein
MFSKKVATATPAPEPVQPTDMVSLRKQASYSLKKNGLEVDGTGGIAVYLVLDHSVSMRGYYRNGDVQRITEQALALAVEIDADGEVPVFYFGSEVSDPVIVSIKDPQSPQYYQGWVGRTHSRIAWGSTNYTDAIKAVARYHAEHGAGAPGLVIFQTDGSPDSRPAARQTLVDVSGQSLFFAFVGFGPKEYVDFLFELDEIAGRTRDNASAFHAVDPQRTLDADLYDGILKEFTGEWLPQVL